MLRVSVLIGATALLLLAACVVLAPAATPTPATPITREQAIEIALQRLTSMPEVTAVENPRNPVARLMKLRDYDVGYATGSPFLPNPDTLVWVVQFEGTSYSAGIAAEPRTQYSYAMVVMDAQSGNVITGSRTFAPRF